MSKLATLPLPAVLDAFASNEPVPGGGSASALAGALGVSLLIMVSRLPTTRTGAPHEAAVLARSSSALRPLRDRLTTLVDEDSDAYRQVLAALRHPRASDAEKSQRRDALATAMRAATEAPLATMRACRDALKEAVVVMANGTATATSDVGVGIELLIAAMRGSALNVDTNLALLKDEQYVARVRVERQELDAECMAQAEQARLVRI